MHFIRLGNFGFKPGFLGLVFCLVYALGNPVAESKGIKSTTPQEIYDLAKSKYYSLKRSKTAHKIRQDWLDTIQAFKIVLQKYPKSFEAYKAAFTIAKLYQESYKAERDEEDLNQALKFYRKVLTTNRPSSLEDDAKFSEGDILMEQKNFSEALVVFKQVVELYPDGDQVSKSKQRIRYLEALLPKNLAKKEIKNKNSFVIIEKVHFSENQDRARIKIETNGPSEVTSHRLTKPERFYLDIKNARIQEGLPKTLSMKNGWLQQIRLSQFEHDTSRVVLDLRENSNIDVQTKTGDSTVFLELYRSAPLSKTKNLDRNALASPAKKAILPAPKKRKFSLIVLDPGHGGKDDGAQGRTGVLEKDLNLKISKIVKLKLERLYGYKVVMTRTDDTFISLDKRGEIANDADADLFVSIHANAALRRGALGIETYYLGWRSSERARDTAARENGDIIFSSPDNDVQNILADMDANRKINSSACLAGKVQSHLFKGMSKKYNRIKNLGVKEGPFYVLHKAYMPSILIEVGFITNALEERRLRSQKYLERLAANIAKGISNTLPIEKKCGSTI